MKVTRAIIYILGQSIGRALPSEFYDSVSVEFFVYDDGYLNDSYVNYNIGVRGVVSLSSESKLLGSGTYNDVYTVN